MIIQLPNGETAEFPDTMQPQEIEAVLQKQFGAPQQQPQQPELRDVMAESLSQFQPSSIMSAQTAKEQLPVIGSMATVPLKMAGAAAIPVAGMGAAAGGLMAGHGGEPMGGEGSLMPFNASLGDFAAGAGGEGAGQVVMGVAKKALAPFAAKLAENPTAKLGQEMVDAGIPLSPDVYAPTKTAKVSQWITDTFLPGSAIANQRRKELVNAMSQMREDFISGLGMPNPATPLAESKKLEKAAYQVFNQEGKGLQIPFENTAKFIADNAEQPAAQTSKFWKTTVNDFYNKVQPKKGQMLFSPEEVPANQRAVYDYLAEGADTGIPGNATINDVNEILANLWPRKGADTYEKMTQATVDLRNGLKDAINADLAAYDSLKGTQVLELLDKARQTVKDTAELRKSKIIEKFLSNATTFNPETQQMVFNPGKFYSDITKNADFLQRKLPDQFNNILAFAEKSKLAATDYARMGPKNSIQQAVDIGTLGGGLAAGIMNPILTVPLGFQAIAAYSLMNPSGVIRKWLTTGIKPPKLLKEGVKLGIMEATND